MEGQKVIGAVLVLLGLFYALAPHAMHVSSGLGLGLEHSVHQVLGVVLLVAGAWLGWMMKPKKAAGGARRRRKR